jgi:hypothetical protein
LNLNPKTVGRAVKKQQQQQEDGKEKESHPLETITQDSPRKGRRHTVGPMGPGATIERLSQARKCS